jgi:hypothetical protein
MGEVGRGILKAPKQPFSPSGSQSSNVGWSILKWQRRRPVTCLGPNGSQQPCLGPNGSQQPCPGSEMVVSSLALVRNGSQQPCPGSEMVVSSLALGPKR